MSTVMQHEVALSIDPATQSSASKVVSSLPSQEETESRENFLKYGLPLYQAALQGDWETAEGILEESRDWIRESIAKRGERVLHIAAAAKQTYFVKQLVKQMEGEDLALRNENENTALCLAATSGVVEIARAMVEKEGQLPNVRGSQGMTPLQMAALLGHRDMVWYLLSVTDDKQLTDQDRVALLTASIETNLFDVARHILAAHRNLAILRDGKKETPLHALARKLLKPCGYEQKTCKRLGSILAEAELQAQPIELQLVQSLWDEVIKQDEHTISYLIGWPWRFLFEAAKLGNVEFLTIIIRSYPDVIWKVDDENRSIFHIAIINRHEEIFKLIYELGAIKDLIAINKDGRGNTMLHLAGALAPPHRLNCISGAALQMQRELLWYKAVEKVVRPEYAELQNRDGKTPHALFTENHEKLRIKGEEWMKKTAESCTLVATLIATVVFAAAFTLPGGIDSGGNPSLVNRPLFMLFAIANAISLFSSSASILMFLSILTSRYAEQDFLRSLPLKLVVGLTGLFVSIATMTVAFTATFFITFKKGVEWIPIPIALFAAVPVTLFALEQYPLLRDIYCSTYRSWSLFEPIKPKLFQNCSKVLKRS